MLYIHVKGHYLAVHHEITQYCKWQLMKLQYINLKTPIGTNFQILNKM